MDMLENGRGNFSLTAMTNLFTMVMRPARKYRNYTIFHVHFVNQAMLNVNSAGIFLVSQKHLEQWWLCEWIFFYQVYQFDKLFCIWAFGNKL
jgi:hypothetical protein